MPRRPTATELRKAAAGIVIDNAPNPRLGPSLVVEGPAPAPTRVPSRNSTRGREEGSSVKDSDARDADEPRKPFANEVIEADALEAVLTPGNGNPSRTQGYPKFADDPADSKLADHRTGALNIDVADTDKKGAAVTELDAIKDEQGVPRPTVKTDKTKMNSVPGADVRADATGEPVDPDKAEAMRSQRLSEHDLADDRRPQRKAGDGATTKATAKKATKKATKKAAKRS